MNEKKIFRPDASLPRDFDPSMVKEEIKRELSDSAQLAQQLIQWTEAGSNFGKFTELSIDDEQELDPHFFESTHIAAVVSMVPRFVDRTPDIGLIHPENKIIMGKRSADSSWGAETWAIPMGKVEEQDVVPGKTKFHEVITNAGIRELDEEVVKDPVKADAHYIASFQDSETGNIIHVVINTVHGPESGEQAIHVELPDLREHSDLGWVYLRDLEHLQPMSDGVKLILKKVFEYIKAKNEDLASKNP